MNMAYQLPSYTTDAGLTATNAYLRITNVSIAHVSQTAVVSFAIYVSETAAANGKQPIKTDGYAFDSTLFSSTFGSITGTSPLTAPTTVKDILWTEAYLAMLQSSSLTTLLTGATAV
jgi:hypothetical protein